MPMVRTMRFVDGPHAGRCEGFYGGLPSVITRHATWVGGDGEPWIVGVIYERDWAGNYSFYRVEVVGRGWSLGPVMRG